MRDYNMLSTDVIPHGLYCYSYINGKFTECPYWSIDPAKPKQECGYCAYVQSGDWDVAGLSLLWDQVKECGINV